MNRVSVPEIPIENYVRMPDPTMNLGRHELDRIAALSYERQRARMPSMLISTPYGELSEKERDALRTHALRTIESLVFLGWIELPS